MDEKKWKVIFLGSNPKKKSENKKKSGCAFVEEKSIAKCLRVGCEKINFKLTVKVMEKK